MSFRRKMFRVALLALVLLPHHGLLEAVDREEGGYVGLDGLGADKVVYNFLKHFSYEQYYWGITQQYTSNNDNRVDAMDFAYYCGHGSNWSIGLTNGSVDITTAGGTSHKGWGTVDAEFVAFYSCQVVPSPLEVADWYSNWTSESDDVFDRLHQALGFRTNASVANSQATSDYFGKRISQNYGVWESWFDAISKKAQSWEKGAAVMHPSCDGDTYGSFAPDPPETSNSLRIWYQL